MRRGTLFIILFVLIAGVIIAASTLLQNQPPLDITVAVDPLAEAWLRDAALAYNQSGTTVGVSRRVRVNIIVKSDTALLTSPWTPNDNPDGWVPAWSSVANISRSSSVTPQTAVLSLARTPLVWMSYASRAGEIDDISWSGIRAVAANNRVDLAFSLPTNSVQGLGALISGAADFHQTAILNEALLSDTQMRNWLAPIVTSVPNFNTIGANVAQFVAGAQGGSVDAAIAPESQWLNALQTLAAKGQPRFAYPSNPVVFDFPFIVLRDSASTDDQVSAAQSFAAFLASDGQQVNAERFGLRPAQRDPLADATLFNRALPYGITLDLPAAQPVQLPSSSSISALNQWFSNITR